MGFTNGSQLLNGSESKCDKSLQIILWKTLTTTTAIVQIGIDLRYWHECDLHINSAGKKNNPRENNKLLKTAHIFLGAYYALNLI